MASVASELIRPKRRLSRGTRTLGHGFSLAAIAESGSPESTAAHLDSALQPATPASAEAIREEDNQSGTSSTTERLETRNVRSEQQIARPTPKSQCGYDERPSQNDLLETGAGGGNRTRMTLRSGDFESPASTSFTTPASGAQHTTQDPVLALRWQLKAATCLVCALTGSPHLGRIGLPLGP
jgi:hypothetical protein